MIAIQKEDDNVNVILDNKDVQKYCNDVRRDNIAEASNDFCNNAAGGINTGYATILSYKKDYSNSTLSGEKPLVSHKVSKKPKVSSINLISYMELNATIENLSDSYFGIPNTNALDLDGNLSEPLGKYQCFVCPLNFAEKNDLSKHLMKHFDRHRPYMCQVCEKTFRKMDNLKTHINCCMDITPYQCEQCDKAFTTSSKLCQHRRTTHSGMSPYKCEKCDYKTFQRNNLNRHISIHMDERPFKCNYCSYTSKSQRYLTSHERIHKDVKIYECDICYSRFVQTRSLRDHRKKHFLNSLCSFCALDLGSPDALRKHVEDFHIDEILK